MTNGQFTSIKKIVGFRELATKEILFLKTKLIKGNGMSAFGIKILTRVLIPYTFGIFFTYFGGKRLLKKEKVVESVLYTLLGLFLSLGAIIHLLFVANIGMYS